MRALGMSRYAVNRAVRGQVAAGLLRREGYRLHPVAAPNRRKVAAPHVILPHDPQGPATASAEARLWDTQVISLGDRFHKGRQSLESMVGDLIDGPCHSLLIRRGPPGRGGAEGGIGALVARAEGACPAAGGAPGAGVSTQSGRP